MRGDLLWIYEGLTEYLGWVLTGRSGLLSEDEERESLAETAARMDSTPGRTWRPLEDTAVAAQVLYGSSPEWESVRRSVDFYPEGQLVWLEADVTIRRVTEGRSSLDDFCRRFFGGGDGPPEVRPYDLDEVISALDAVATYDWRGFFQARVMRAAERAPLGGIVGGGYKLAFSEKPNAQSRARETTRKLHEARYSLGVVLDEHDTVLDATPGMPAAAAGLAPGMHIVAIDGRRFSADVLREAIARGKKTTAPLDLLVESDDFFRSVSVDWHGGERHPHLERDASTPDLIAKILAPRTPRPAEAVATPPRDDDPAPPARGAP